MYTVKARCRTITEQKIYIFVASVHDYYVDCQSE